jgi:hypothetical protein
MPSGGLQFLEIDSAEPTDAFEKVAELILESSGQVVMEIYFDDGLVIMPSVVIKKYGDNLNLFLVKMLLDDFGLERDVCMLRGTKPTMVGALTLVLYHEYYVMRGLKRLYRGEEA